MNPNRIALALVLAGLAAPALAEKCHICDFSDEPIVVTPKKSVGLTPLDAPGGLAAVPADPTHAIVSGGSGNDRVSSGRGNDPMQRGDAIGATVLPPPTAAGHEIREHVSFTYQKIIWSAPSTPKAIAVVGSKAPLAVAPATNVMKGATMPQNALPAGPAARR
jgi:hypothetical protein